MCVETPMLRAVSASTLQASVKAMDWGASAIMHGGEFITTRQTPDRIS